MKYLSLLFLLSSCAWAGQDCDLGSLLINFYGYDAKSFEDCSDKAVKVLHIRIHERPVAIKVRYAEAQNTMCRTVLAQVPRSSIEQHAREYYTRCMKGERTKFDLPMQQISQIERGGK